MQRTNIYLEERHVRALAQRAEKAGTSRAAVLRELLDEALADDDHELESDLAAIMSSAGALAGDGWVFDDEVPGRGPSDARRTHLDRIARG